MKLSKKIFATSLAFILLGNLSFSKTLKVGTSPVPQGEILEIIKPELAKKGIDLKIIEFNEYVTPNLALADGELDANFFQHIPYLEKFKEERKLKISSVGDVMVAPIGVFSLKHKSLDELKKGGIIAIPSDPSNGGRALILLHKAGIITLNDPTNLYVTEFDIVENPKKLKFKSIEAPQLPRILRDVDAAVINGNYAIQSGLSLKKDALLVEGKDSPYINIVAARDEDLNNPDIKAFVDELRTEKVKKFIDEKYQGALITTF
ncbi:MetQ/NlpA family ABC transporter substrate-binding protein [Fusobacterium sp.]|uniref:MetQ/NlpA family ABC transporter substrate-binding protein n=1 Tax=Fusobacterium sp. TaxID=68766 RepID=UPI002631F293|nr:MetQ/NlpA family ABC transporter substrate-binding protein [Fusobacterium sp.]